MAVASIEQKRKTSSNGGSTAETMQGVLHHLPDSLPSKQYWRDWLKARWFGLTKEWEPVVVNKQIDSVTMPKWVAVAILGAMLAFMAQSYWRSSDQRDMLIELKTELRMQKEFEVERTKEFKEQADLNKVYIDNMTNQLNIIKGMLSAQQMNAVESAKRGNN